MCVQLWLQPAAMIKWAESKTWRFYRICRSCETSSGVTTTGRTSERLEILRQNTASDQTLLKMLPVKFIAAILGTVVFCAVQSDGQDFSGILGSLGNDADFLVSSAISLTEEALRTAGAECDLDNGQPSIQKSGPSFIIMAFLVTFGMFLFRLN
ncbi:hypothetical protein PoB_007464100 [Plakobranchus ocellatus]|uniref:Uncharacterized protein n=1 Tax=Plakobranchus ocellatus TaxID=259542 RepID=A0AAV4DWB5_9GAST|nr:hypothetical protein PoB_007464100 [Plakobranchus ocellatus]